MVEVKRSTALARLGDVADALENTRSWRDSVVVAGFVYGELLEGSDDLERVRLAFVVDLPVEAVVWMTRPARLEAFAGLLRFDRLPLSWRWRPVGWPVWNHEITRAVCFWSAADGRRTAVFDGLRLGRTEGLELEHPSSEEELVEQLLVEREVARRHVQTTVDRFYERDWRLEHRGHGVHPEDHLWWAIAGFLDLDDAVGPSAG
jgi:hypothetical protein